MQGNVLSPLEAPRKYWMHTEGRVWLGKCRHQGMWDSWQTPRNARGAVCEPGWSIKIEGKASGFVVGEFNLVWGSCWCPWRVCGLEGG